MKIIDLIEQNSVTFSCEIFPPKPHIPLDECKSVSKELPRPILTLSALHTVQAAAIPNAPLKLQTIFKHNIKFRRWRILLA